MKLSKGQGISLFTAIIIFGIFNTIVFLAPLAHTVNFWLGYFFALFALITIALTLVLYFGKPVKEEKFLSLPAVKVAWTYFVLQTALSVWEMISFPLPYLPSLIINLVLGGIFSVIILALHAASSKINKSEEYTAEKVVFIKQLKLRVDLIETDNVELAKKIKELSEDVRYSDPMSHSKLVDIENSLARVIDELTDSINDAPKALDLCHQASKMLKTRNEQCKMYKGVKDTVAATKQKSDNGAGIALAGVGVALAMFLITLTVCFIIIPTQKYNAAKAILELEKYPEAIVAFEALGDFKDSELQIEIAKNAILQKKYDAATELFSNEKYDEAIVAFTEIRDFKDSTDKIQEIENTVKQNKYNVAEEYFNNGKYSEAINIYSSLGNFKDSKLRVEQIYNRLSDGDIIHFGTYNDKPIAWKILKTESDKMLLLAEKPITQKPFTDDIKKVTWETSSLRTWLNEEFINSFSTEQQNQILATDTGSTDDKIFLLSVNEIIKLDETVRFKTEEEWWTRTSAENGIKYMTAKGWLISKGDQVVRDKGVRPAIWISLV